MKVIVGDKIYLPDQKYPYSIKARNERFIICTKPFNPKHTVLYFIIDLKLGVRGTDDRLFCPGYETDEDCLNNLENLENGLLKVSRRNYVNLDIDIE